MKISIIQPDTLWEDKEANFDVLSEMISVLPETDIIILPETFNTGFSMNPELLSETSQSVTWKWMAAMAKLKCAGICGSYIVKDGEKYFNRWVFVSPDNETWHYDKRHLFRMSGEEYLFTSGCKRITLNFRGIRILPNVCYDLRFPVWTRNRNDYDLIINSANWPASRRDVWLTLLRARAIENQCFVVGANRVGTDGKGIRYCGDSMLISPKGEILAIGGDEETSVTAEISIDELNQFRNKFPVSGDADTFSVSI
jgi:omega-amidase